MTGTEQIRVAVVNDYQVVVEGVAAMLRSYSDLVRVVELDVNARPVERVDIALYDTFAALPGNQADIRRLVRDGHVRLVAVYTWNLDHELIEASLDNGASAYLSKELPAAKLVEALIAVHAGRQPEATHSHRLTSPIGNDWPGREEGLTLRESEVLALITQGLSNDEVAERMYLSVNSVKTHIRTCYRRIGVTNRANAVLWGIDHGFRPATVRTLTSDGGQTV
ncbi:response regulator transcription factor [Microbacterium sp. KR10-403]|uniref:helix-turn-helix transcriptional regulator n=1 Tax=Microbacterium sp. KR10-403 TaxID=3158581 RepID=UPI0032E4498F